MHAPLSHRAPLRPWAWRRASGLQARCVVRTPDGPRPRSAGATLAGPQRVQVPDGQSADAGCRTGAGSRLRSLDPARVAGAVSRRGPALSRLSRDRRGATAISHTGTALSPSPATTVHLLTLGCARNEVDSEELAGRLSADGFRVVTQPEAADAVLVNTCGFIETARKDSVDALLAAADLKDNGRTRAVVAVGCMAERYGAELAEAMPEADAVLGFDAYADMAGRLRSIMAGGGGRGPPPPA